MEIAAEARECIVQARQQTSNGCYSKAVELYFMAFEKSPVLRPVFEFDFRSILMKLSEILAADNKYEDILSNFNKTIRMFPNNVFFLNETGKYLYKFGYYEEAWHQFQSALMVDAGHVNAEKNLNSMKNYMVERWHFRMLNDKIRNGGYRAALHEMIEPRETTILDLGTGTGLLAMYASECNPLSITACDSSSYMISLADCILNDNHLLMSVVIVNKMSTKMKSVEIGGKCSLLVTEIFDAGLFGERILQSLSHAWNNLLTDTAQVIPHSAEFFILGVHSDMLNSKYQLNSHAKFILDIPNFNVHVLMSGETYDCDDVFLYNDIKYITESVSVIKVNFTDMNDIQNKLCHTDPYVVQLKALEKGKINIYIGFFNLYLTTNITITTDPRIKYRSRAWQQAVFYDSLPRNVLQNEIINVELLMNEGNIRMQTNSSDNILRISPETIRFLNDTVYMEMIKRCIGVAFLYLGQMTEMEEVSIVDLCPFPMFGFLMLKRGVKSLVCYAKTEYDKKFVEEVFSANGLEMQGVKFLIGDSWPQESFGEDKYHAIFCNILDICGDIDIRYVEIANHLRSNHLIEGGLFMPSSVSVIAQIVSSDWLNINNRVYDENVHYKVSPHINKYQVSQNYCLDYTNLEYTPLSDEIDMGNYSSFDARVINVPIMNNGEANAILCWYKIELVESLDEVSTKRPCSFIDGIAFLANPIIPMAKGNIANILLCVDYEGSFKLIMDKENT